MVNVLGHENSEKLNCIAFTVRIYVYKILICQILEYQTKSQNICKEKETPYKCCH